MGADGREVGHLVVHNLFWGPMLQFYLLALIDSYQIFKKKKSRHALLLPHDFGELSLLSSLGGLFCDIEFYI
jgi:hypothetical protein